MKPSEEIELGDTGMKLQNGILVDKTGEPIKEEPKCPGCHKPFNKCDCVVAFEEG